MVAILDLDIHINKSQTGRHVQKSGVKLSTCPQEFVFVYWWEGRQTRLQTQAKSNHIIAFACNLECLVFGNEREDSGMSKKGQCCQSERQDIKERASEMTALFVLIHIHVTVQTTKDALEFNFVDETRQRWNVQTGSSWQKGYGNFRNTLCMYGRQKSITECTKRHPRCGWATIAQHHTMLPSCQPRKRNQGLHTSGVCVYVG